MSSLPWYIYLLQFVAGLFLANGVPHFVQGGSAAPGSRPRSPPRRGSGNPRRSSMCCGGSSISPSASRFCSSLPRKGRTSSSNGCLSAWARWSWPSFVRGILGGCGRGAVRVQHHWVQPASLSRASAKRSSGTQGARRFPGSPRAIARSEGRASLDPLWLLAMTVQFEALAFQAWPTGPTSTPGFPPVAANPSLPR